MKKKILSFLLAVMMIIGMLPLSAITAFAETDGGEVEYLKLHSTPYGLEIGEWGTVSYYLVDSDITCTADEAGEAGLSIVEGAEVHIFVEKGVTLTCKGGDATLEVGGGAGIEVPEYATLYLEGEGTVIATGGKAADGTDGDDGQAGSFYMETKSFALWSWDKYYCYGGDGGAGGHGGGGAGAGIGTAGGAGSKGGAGGKGDGGDADEDHLNVTAGEKGHNGVTANPMGTVRTSPTVKLTATGGARGKGGNSTIKNWLALGETSDYYNTGVPGCAGGGGQGGGAGASVGTGGRGGGGGAGGNGSPALSIPNWIAWETYYGAILYSGYGGGNTDGNYVAGSNMGHGGDEYNMTDTLRCKYNDYPYRERNFGGAGGTDGVEHTHTFDEDDCCIVCAKPVFLIEDGVLLEYNGFGGEIVIPEGVTKIADNVFAGNKTVTGVVLPSTLEEIGASAFQGTPLTRVDIPVSVKAIGYNAFRDCKNLKNVTVHWAEADKIVTPQGDAFTGIASDCALSVPNGTAQLYKNHTVWGKFPLISDTMPYMAYDPESKMLVQKVTPEAPTMLTSTDEPVALTGGWYAVDGEVTIEKRITVSGDTGLILKDGCKLTLKEGLEVSAHDSLTIYGQTEETGELITPRVSENYAAIGLSDFAVLNIHGGKIEVRGGNYAAGIGGYQADSGTVTVYGGSVTAHGSSGGAGIGCYSFTVYGGKVGAYGDNSAAISGNVTVNGGEVDVNNTVGGTDSKVVINDGKVTVTGDKGVVGGNNSTVEINGGDIKVSNNITIGVDYYTGHDAEITIRGGNIDAYCYYYPAIGGNANGVNVNIYGGSIKAKSNSADGAIVAKSVNVYPDAEKCERFTVKDLSGNELSGSPVTEEKDITSILSENKQVQIEPGVVHTFTGDYVNNGDGTHSRKCSVCGVLNAAVDHTFENHTCVCGATNTHDFTGEYKDNGDGTHSKQCVCGETGEALPHKDVDHDALCDLCGAEILAENEFFVFSAKNLALESDLGFRFKGYAGKDIPDSSYMEFRIGSLRIETVPLSEATMDELGRFVFTCHLNVLEAGEPLNAVFHTGETEDRTVSTNSAISVSDYLEAVALLHEGKSGEIDRQTIIMVNATANYLHYAQIALDETHPNYTVGTTDSTYVLVEARTALDAKTKDDLISFKAVRTTSPDFDKISKTSRSLLLDDKTSIVIYLTPSDPSYIPSVSVTDGKGGEIAFTLNQQTDGRYRVVIGEIGASALGESFTVSIDGGKMTISNLSALSYAYSVLAGESSEANRNAVSALYAYSLAADDYKTVTGQ